MRKTKGKTCWLSVTAITFLFCFQVCFHSNSSNYLFNRSFYDLSNLPLISYGKTCSEYSKALQGIAGWHSRKIDCQSSHLLLKFFPSLIKTPFLKQAQTQQPKVLPQSLENCLSVDAVSFICRAVNKAGKRGSLQHCSCQIREESWIGQERPSAT